MRRFQFLYYPHSSNRKQITVITYTDKVSLKYKIVCFTDGSKFNERVGLECFIYEDEVEKATFQHWLKKECSVFQAELFCINHTVKFIQDSLRLNGIQFSYLHWFAFFTSFIAEYYSYRKANCGSPANIVQPLRYWRLQNLFFVCSWPQWSIDRDDQLAKEVTGLDIDLSVSVPLSCFKHLAWLESVFSWN